MTQLLIFTLFIGICLAVTPEQFAATCETIPDEDCCNRKSPTMPSVMEKFEKECTNSSETECEFQICVSNKSGFATEDGEVDFDKALKFFENNYPEYSDSVVACKEICTAERMSNYRLGDDPCKAAELQTCFLIQMSYRCPEWRDDSECAGVAEKAAKCLKMFA